MTIQDIIDVYNDLDEPDRTFLWIAVPAVILAITLLLI
jgi:hypothetical protein